jgi:hypothetical protein
VGRGALAGGDADLDIDRAPPPGAAMAFQASMMTEEGRQARFRLLLTRADALPEDGAPNRGVLRLTFDRSRPPALISPHAWTSPVAKSPSHSSTTNDVSTLSSRVESRSHICVLNLVRLQKAGVNAIELPESHFLGPVTKGLS